MAINETKNLKSCEGERLITSKMIITTEYQESKPKNNKINFKSNEQAKLFSQFIQNDKTRE